VANNRTLVLEPVLPAIGKSANIKGAATRPASARLKEACGLAGAIDLEVIASQIITVNFPHPSTLFGKGKLAELADIIIEKDIYVVIVDHPITPVQQRNLERKWAVKVIDRTGLIIEIFGDRAKTHEGKLQVELAHLVYQKSRLVRAWTHLERQRGGLGFVGGPGETQMEADRRMLQAQINAIRRKLETVTRTRALHRKQRRQVPYPVVALVGYTNAGKSTLFNRLTGAGVMAKDMLFATLDPTMRQLVLPSGGRVVISDTVGFISDLPTSLIAAFRATLEEVREADIILHVRDISSPETQAERSDVIKVLEELRIEPLEGDAAKIVEVWNKSDLLDHAQREKMLNVAKRSETPVALVSALGGSGVAELLAVIDEICTGKYEILCVTVSAGDGKLVNWLYEHGEVLERNVSDNGDMAFSVRMSPANAERMKSLTKHKA
jgi:GTP-binding protein HflX